MKKIALAFILLMFQGSSFGVDISDRSHDFFFTNIFPKTIPSFRIANEISKRLQGGETSFTVAGIIKVISNQGSINIENTITNQSVGYMLNDFTLTFGDWPENPEDEISKDDYANWQIRQQWEKDISEHYREIIAVSREMKMREAEASAKNYTGTESIDEGTLCTLGGKVSSVTRPGAGQYIIGVKLNNGDPFKCMLDADATDGLFWLELGDTIKLHGKISISKKELADAEPLLINDISINAFRDQWNERAREIISMGMTIRNTYLYPNPRNPSASFIFVRDDRSTATAWINMEGAAYSDLSLKDISVAIAIDFMAEESGGIAFATIRDDKSDKVVFEVAGISNTQQF